MNFDPMTGEPINQPEQGNMNFDPMTGEPIQNTEGGTMNFDPMTGQPIQNTEGGTMNFDPMTGRPISSGNVGMSIVKGGKWKIAAGIAAGVVVVGGIVFAGVSSGAFLSKGNKVLLATSNTFSDEGELAADLGNITSIIESGKYTVAVTGEADGAEVALEYIDASSKKQIQGTVDSGYVEVEVNAAVNNKKLAVQVPTIDDRVFVYNYTKNNDGYLVEELGEETVESLNELLKTLCSSKEQEKLAEDLTDAVFAEYKELDFEKVEKEEYEVNGKDRKCKGYETTITSDNMLNVLDNMEEVLEDEYGDALEEVDVDLGDMFSDLRKEFRNMPDIDVTFYIYKNKLACINMDVEGEEAEILFLGGDTRTQNMKVEIEGETLLEVKGSTEKGVERSRIYVDDDEVCDMKYNYKEGELTIESSDLYLEADIDAGSRNVTVTINDLEVDGMDLGVEGQISVKKGAKVTMPKGDEFDLGNASEGDFEDLIEDIEDAMYSL